MGAYEHFFFRGSFTVVIVESIVRLKSWERLSDLLTISAKSVEKMESSSFSDRYHTGDSTSASEDDRRRGSMSNDEYGLYRALETADDRKKLRAIAESQHCVENVLFFEVYFELKTASSASARMALAGKLLRKYLLPDAPREVNLEHSTRVAMEGLANRIDRRLINDCPHTQFDLVAHEVRKNLLSSVWPAFKEGTVPLSSSGRVMKLKSSSSKLAFSFKKRK